LVFFWVCGIILGVLIGELIMSSNEKLSPKAYQVLDGKDYPSFIPASEAPQEFTLKAVIIGILIGIIFGAANAYLGLKVGLTVSASIPAAVMAVAIFKIFFKGGSILETNIVQTVGSAGESLAAGVIFTIPAFFLWGMEPSKLEITTVALVGGAIGVLFMIPLRRYLIVKEHGKLPYPEGTACAEVLVAGQGDVGKAKTLFKGMGIGALYQALMHDRLFGLWSVEPSARIPGFKGAEVGAEVTPELLGVGYIIGPQISAIMLGGGIMGWLVLIPLIFLFGEHANAPIYPELTTLIKDMDPGLIWSRYIRYIGAGGVAFAGMFSLIKSIPVICSSFKAGISQMGKGSADTEVERTDQDLSMRFIAIGSTILALIAAAYLYTSVFKGALVLSLVAAFLILLFGFFFVTVSSRIVGLLGSSSNPVSGMTIATLLLTCVIFLLAGLGDMPNVKIAALTVGAFVCIASAIAGDASQDLKTGFLVGSTPKYQQLGELFGVASAALTMGIVMYFLKDAIVAGDLPAPQANLMKLVVDGVIGGNLPWGLVIGGAFIALCVELLGINSLAFAVGLYLPLSLSVPIMVGGIIRWVLERRTNDEHLEVKRENGVLYSSGLIAGAALTGVCIMILVGLADKAPCMLETFSRPGIHLESSELKTVEINGEALSGSYKKISVSSFPKDEKSQKLRLKATLGKATLEKELELAPWEKAYINHEKGELTVASEPARAMGKAVMAFFLLTASLAWVALRKP
jgi:putative OPT family oligopeptide transporter